MLREPLNKSVRVALGPPRGLPPGCRNVSANKQNEMNVLRLTFDKRRSNEVLFSASLVTYPLLLWISLCINGG